MRQQGQAAVIAGVVLLVIGGVMITLGWDGAAGLDYVQGQFPYLLSASVPGIALIIVGTTVLVLSTVRRDAAERAAQLEKLNASITELASLVGPRDPYDPTISGVYRPRPRASTNGGDSEASTQDVSAGSSFEQGR